MFLAWALPGLPPPSSAHLPRLPSATGTPRPAERRGQPTTHPLPCKTSGRWTDRGRLPEARDRRRASEIAGEESRCPRSHASPLPSGPPPKTMTALSASL